MTVDERTRRIAARRRYGLVAFASLYTFLVFGAFLGWGPMQLMLEDNGNFASKCTPEEQESGVICPEQSAALVNVNFYALVSQIASPILGILADRYGSIRLAYGMTACAWLGFGLLIVATRYVIDALLYPAFFLYGICVWLGVILNMHVGLFFVGHTRSRVIFGMSSLFDAGAITFVGLRAIQENTAATVPHVIGGYFGVTLMLFGCGSYFWTVARPVADEDNEKDAPIDPQNTTELSAMVKDVTTTTANAPDVVGANVETTEINDPEVSKGDPTIATSVVDLSSNVVGDDTRNMKEPSEPQAPIAYKLVANRTPRQQLVSLPYLLLAFFWLVHCTANQWTLTTTRDFLASLGDDEVNNRYLTIFTFMMPVSLAALPFTDALLRRFGFSGGFQAINILAVGYCLIRLFSDDLSVQVLGFVIFSFFRSFLFGICLSYLPTLLAPHVVGIGSGVLFFISGISAFLNVPLSTYAIETQNGDFFLPNLLYTLLIIPCIAVAWALGRAIKREDEVKREQHFLKEAQLRQSLGGVMFHDSSPPPQDGKDTQ